MPTIAHSVCTLSTLNATLTAPHCVRAAAAAAGKEIGSVTYTPLCNAHGGVEADMTVTKVDENSWYLPTRPPSPLSQNPSPTLPTSQPPHTSLTPPPPSPHHPHPSAQVSRHWRRDRLSRQALDAACARMRRLHLKWRPS